MGKKKTDLEKLNEIENNLNKIEAILTPIKHNELTAKRIECNELILKQLTEYIHNNPYIRFSQALLNLGIVQITTELDRDNWTDDYYLEPSELIKRMSKG